ncbi:hypothetical protein C8J56DRAFT_885622 [Mycena floridula]|nr:hypothetical protein C8J56DRAFT_885622 [Mycena floridula]
MTRVEKSLRVNTGAYQTVLSISNGDPTVNISFLAHIEERQSNRNPRYPTKPTLESGSRGLQEGLRLNKHIVVQQENYCISSISGRQWVHQAGNNTRGTCISNQKHLDHSSESGIVDIEVQKSCLAGGLWLRLNKHIKLNRKSTAFELLSIHPAKDTTRN